MNWIVSAILYSLTAAGIIASILLHAIPHRGPLMRRTVAVIAFLSIAGLGTWGTQKQYRREHPVASVGISGYIATLDPYGEGSRFAGITWHQNDVDVRLDLANGATDIQNVDFTIQMDTEIAAVGQVGTFPGVTIFPSPTVSISSVTVLDSITGKPTATAFGEDMALAPTYRVQCLNILANTVVRFSIASVAVNPTPPEIGANLLGPRRPPKILTIKGTYETRDGGLVTTHPLEYSTSFKPR